MKPLQRIGILSLGEMGEVVARAAIGKGLSVATCAEGRSAATRARAEAAGVRVEGTLGELVASVDLVLSLVPSSAAEPVLEAFVAACAGQAPPPWFADGNAISLEQSVRQARRLEAAGGHYLDVGVVGTARTPERIRFYISGPGAERLAAAFRPAIDCRVLSDQAGDASRFKLLFSGLPKGIAALALELGAVASSLGLLDELVDCYRSVLPGMLALTSDLLSSYPLHAVRRRDEVRDLVQAIEQAGITPSVARGVLAVLDEAARVRWDPALAELDRVAAMRAVILRFASRGRGR